MGKGLKVTPAILEDFEQFALKRLDSLGIELESPLEARVDALMGALVEEDGYDESLIADYGPLRELRTRAHEEYIGALKGAERGAISRRIAASIESRVLPERALLMRWLSTDETLDRAIELLKEPEAYQAAFGPFDPNYVPAPAQGSDAVPLDQAGKTTLIPPTPGAPGIGVAKP